MGHRPRKVGDQVRRELAELLMNEVNDPRLGFVTVTEVRMSRDLQYAKVWVSVLGDEEDEAESLASLQRASGFLRRVVAQRVRLREAPELRFILDTTLHDSARLERLLRENPPTSTDDDDDDDDDSADP